MKMLLAVVGLLLGTSGMAQAAAHWPQFRGANASGVAEEARPPAKFGPEENVLWKVEVPYAPSSPTIWGELLFLTAFEEGELQTRAYQRADGKLLWTRGLKVAKFEEYHQTEGSPAASTPALAENKVVSYFGSFGLICHDFAGKELWRHPLPVATTGGNFGSGTSPIIVGNRVILNRDLAAGATLLSVDLKTGKKLWETPRADAPTSYTTPIVWNHDGHSEVIVAGSLLMKGYDPANGLEKWVVRGLPSYTCTTPTLGDGMVFFAGWSPGKSDSPWPTWASTVEKQDKNGDGWLAIDEFANGPSWFKAQDLNSDGKLTAEEWAEIGGLMKRGENVLLAVKPGGKGDVTESNVAWKFTRGLPYVPSPLHYQGRIYLVKDGGMASSFDAKTGQAFYSQERLEAIGGYYASPVAAAGRIFVASLAGKVTVFKAGGDKPEILHQADFAERLSATPALVEDKIYLRTQTKLYALGAKGQKIAAK